MGQGKSGTGDAEMRGDLGCAAVECKAGTPAGLAGDFNLQPVDAVGGEASGKAFRGVALAQAVFLFERREDAVQKAVAEAGNRILDAWYFRQVDSRSDQHLGWRLPHR